MAHENATPRPWRTPKRSPRAVCNEAGDKWLVKALVGSDRLKSPRFLKDPDQAEANVALIVEAVNSFDTLRAEVARLEAENAKMQEALTPFANRAGFNNTHQVVSIGACRRAAEAIGQVQAAFFLAGVVEL